MKERMDLSASVQEESMSMGLDSSVKSSSNNL